MHIPVIQYSYEVAWPAFWPWKFHRSLSNGRKCSFRITLVGNAPWSRRLEHSRAKNLLSIARTIDITNGEIQINKSHPKHAINTLIFLAVECHWNRREQSLGHLLSSYILQVMSLRDMKQRCKCLLVYRTALSPVFFFNANFRETLCRLTTPKMITGRTLSV